MIRVSKDPGVRKRELVDIAEKLFIKFGYEETAVSDIVKSAKVAQGTFYYYFKSKDEVLDAIIDKLIIEVKEVTKKIASEKDLDAIGRILQFSVYIRNLGEGREKLVDYLHEDKNALLHLKLEKKVIPSIVPAFSEIIKQGVDEGIFNTDYPTEAAEAIIASSNALSHGEHDHSGKVQYDPHIWKAALNIIERILGAKPGIFNEYIKKMEAKQKN